MYKNTYIKRNQTTLNKKIENNFQLLNKTTIEESDFQRRQILYIIN